jgi:hypothetical protein
MTKKILIGLFVLLLIVISILSYNFYKNIKKPVDSNALIAVPQNASIVVQGNSFKHVFKQLISSNIIWEELVNNSENSAKFNQQLIYLDSLTNDQVINQLINNQSVLASFHSLGANNFDVVYYFSTNSNLDEEKLINHLKTSTKSNATNRIYNEVTIYQFASKEAEKISLIYQKGIIALSYSAVLIEDVVRQLNSTSSLLNDDNFLRAYQTAGESELGNVFVNTSNFSKLINPILNGDSKRYITDLDLFSGWIALDASMHSNALILNGFSNAPDSSNLYLSLFKNQKPQAMDLLQVVPYNASFIYYNSFSDVKSFFKTRKNLLKLRNQASELDALIENYTNNLQLDIEEEWLGFMGNEMAAIITEPQDDSSYNQNCFLVFKLKDTEKAKAIIGSIALKINNENYPINFFNEFPISKIDFSNFFTALFGKPFFNLENPYYTFIDDYLIFGKTENNIQNFISNYSNKKTINQDVNFTAFQENLSSSASIFIYNNIARSVKLYPHFLNETQQQHNKGKTELLQKFEAVAIQINSEKNNLYYNNIYLKYNPVYKQETKSVWETTLDASIYSKPEIVLNHVDNTKEIFVQDESNKIYLISNTGKILWTKQLAEKIIGKVNQVDALKNNKLQLLFNTNSKIYLLDRNGNDVGKFPITLTSQATNGITPMDYEKNKNYRLLIGCENNMVYNYDIEGNVVKGWEYSATKSPATKNITHFTLGGKDYIVIPLENGEIKIIERSGKDRLILKKKLPLTKNPAIIKLHSELNKVYISTLDSSGNVTKLYFNDVLETINFSNVPSNTFFNYFDLNNDNNDDYVFAHNKTLTVLDSEKKIILNYDIEDDITQQPLFFKMPDKTVKIGLVSSSNIYLINQQGVLENNFPLTGSTAFSISNLSNSKALNIVVGDKNSIYMYNLQ